MTRSSAGTAEPTSWSAKQLGVALAGLLAALTFGLHTVSARGGSIPASAAVFAPTPNAKPAATQTIPPYRSRAAALPPGVAVNFPWLTTRDGRPVTWPCGPIRYRVVVDGAPVGAQQLLADAFDRISAVSGYQFQEDPPLAVSPVVQEGYPGIDISWVTRQEFPEASADANVIGVGGASNLDEHYVHGYVKILRDWPGSARADFGPQSVGPVLLHELGHALGLAHTYDPNAIMYPSDQGVSSWSQPESAALRYLQQSCR